MMTDDPSPYNQMGAGPAVLAGGTSARMGSWGKTACGVVDIFTGQPPGTPIDCAGCLTAITKEKET